MSFWGHSDLIWLRGEQLKLVMLLVKVEGKAGYRKMCRYFLRPTVSTSLCVSLVYTRLLRRFQDGIDNLTSHSSCKA